jgi:hypothetical protein
MTGILGLSDELLVMICRYALCPAHGVSFIGEPSFGLGKCKVRCEDRKRIAAGLFFTNHRLSGIAIPILYGENTFCFSTELRAIMEFFRCLGPKNLKRIKAIYLRDPLQTHSEGSVDEPLLSWATTFLHRKMSLSSFSIAVPVRMEMDGKSSYRHSNHGQLSATCLRMIQDGGLKEVRFVRRWSADAYGWHEWEGEASAFGDKIVKNFAEGILLDKEKCEEVQERRRSCIKWKCGIPAGKYHKRQVEQVEKCQARYRQMLIEIRSIWKNAGLVVEGESSYLRGARSTVVIKRLEEVL